MINKKIVKLTWDDEIGMHNEPIDYGIVYIGGRGIELDNILESIEGIYLNAYNKKLEEDKILKNYINNKNIKNQNLFKEVFKEMKEDYEIEENKNLIDLINSGYTSEIIQYLDNMVENKDQMYNDILVSNGLKSGTVGYSDWSYYIAIEKIEHNFIDDLWNGVNFYNLQLIEDDDIVGSISGLYLENTEDLKESINAYFNIEYNNYVLVDNEEAKYFNIEKVEEVQYITYEYKKIK